MEWIWLVVVIGVVIALVASVAILGANRSP